MERRDVFEFGAFRADVPRKTLTRNGEVVPLPAKAFDVLHALLQKPGQTLTKDELMKEVWPNTFVEEGNLTQMIFLLRKALGETESGQALIVTVPRQGYRFVGVLNRDPGEAPPPPGPAIQPPPSVEAIASGPKPGLKNMWWMIAAVAIVAGIGGWVIGRHSTRKPATSANLVRFIITPDANTNFRAAKLSPDGLWLALAGMDSSGKTRLWVRRLDAPGAQSLAAMESYWPFWSPDSRFVAFVQDGKLMKIDPSGGAPQTICDAPLVVGGTWNRNGTILFGDGSVLLRVSAEGGEPQPLTQLNPDRGGTTHDFPVFLPDGAAFPFYNS